MGTSFPKTPCCLRTSGKCQQAPSIPQFTLPLVTNYLVQEREKNADDQGGTNRYFTHDPQSYHDPLTFKPERFLNTSTSTSTNGHTHTHTPEPDPHMYVFGFGRRICPGKILADNALYLTIAQSLAVFSIGKAKLEATSSIVEAGDDDDGKEVSKIEELEIKFQPGVVSHPVPYRNTITPRSAHHEELIRKIENMYPWQESDAKTLESMS